MPLPNRDPGPISPATAGVRVHTTSSSEAAAGGGGGGGANVSCTLHYPNLLLFLGNVGVQQPHNVQNRYG